MNNEYDDEQEKKEILAEYEKQCLEELKRFEKEHGTEQEYRFMERMDAWADEQMRQPVCVSCRKVPWFCTCRPDPVE